MAAEEGKGFRRFSPEAEALLRAHPWPGNVRELQNVVREAVVMNEGEAIEAGMLPIAAAPASAATMDLDAFADSAVHSLRQLKAAMVGGLKDIQRSAIEQAIAECGGSIPRAARLLGVAPSTVYRRREAWEQTGRPC
jgi:two-component system repressor protein LuxO